MAVAASVRGAARSFYYHSFSMQMSSAEAINATWVAPEGTAGADTFLQRLDKTIVLRMKKG